MKKSRSERPSRALVETNERFWFFGGKGGVGKTTCAAAAAVRAAREGRRVLVVSTDPAHSLADALSVPLGREPKRVRGTLHAAQLDADRALEGWLGRREDAFRTIAERGTYLDREDIDKLLSLSLPGVDELVGLVELARLARIDVWDDVVVDTAPTGHTLRLLEMPETLRRFAGVLDDMHAKHRFLAASLGRGYRPDFADDAIADVEKDAADITSILTDARRASFTWVTLAEELPVCESRDGISAIEGLGVRVPVVVVNRVWPVPDRPCPRCTPRARDEGAWIDLILRELASKTLLEVPAAAEEPRGVDALARVAASVRLLEKRTVPAAVPRVRAKNVTRAELPARKLVLFGGKGGVGKTTCAAAFALDLGARTRGDVLVLSTDPAHSLGDALAKEIGDEPTPVAENVVARELDAKKAFAVERDRYRGAIDDLFSSIFKGRMDATYDRQVLEDLLDLAPPGIDEIFALVSIVDALVPSRGRKPAYAHVVVDTAPTGHTLRLLALPESALEWVHAIMSVLLKYRHVIGLGNLATDLTELSRRLRALVALVHDAEATGFVAVTRPARLPRLETERLVTSLEQLQIPLTAIIVNGVTPDDDCTTCTAVAERERPEIARLRRDAPELISTPAVYPGPRGAAELAAFRARWSYAARSV